MPPCSPRVLSIYELLIIIIIIIIITVDVVIIINVIYRLSIAAIFKQVNSSIMETKRILVDNLISNSL